MSLIYTNCSDFSSTDKKSNTYSIHSLLNTIDDDDLNGEYTNLLNYFKKEGKRNYIVADFETSQSYSRKFRILSNLILFISDKNFVDYRRSAINILVSCLSKDGHKFLENDAINIIMDLVSLLEMNCEYDILESICYVLTHSNVLTLNNDVTLIIYKKLIEMYEKHPSPILFLLCFVEKLNLPSEKSDEEMLINFFIDKCSRSLRASEPSSIVYSLYILYILAEKRKIDITKDFFNDINPNLYNNSRVLDARIYVSDKFDGLISYDELIDYIDEYIQNKKGDYAKLNSVISYQSKDFNKDQFSSIFKRILTIILNNVPRAIQLSFLVTLCKFPVELFRTSPIEVIQLMFSFIETDIVNHIFMIFILACMIDAKEFGDDNFLTLVKPYLLENINSISDMKYLSDNTVKFLMDVIES